MAAEAPSRPVLVSRARAKVNLTLRVLGRRADGYHELESLVAFAGVGDTLTLEPGPDLALTIAGPRGAGLPADESNLVLRAARLLADEVGTLRWGRFHLVKRLPVASGIGGGSADAAAALRLLAQLNDIPLDAPVLLTVAARIGADVPVCLTSRARMMAGIGERLGPALKLPPLFAVLVNPGVPAATPAVFRELGLQPGQARTSHPRPHPEEPRSDAISDDRAPQDEGWCKRDLERAALLTALVASGNDLESPARRVAPVIGDVLDALAELPGCRLARMSGSGATCFAVFDDCRRSAAVARVLAKAHPAWWIRPTLFR